MAPRKPPEETEAEQSTLIFPKKTILEELAETKRTTTTRAQAATGKFGAAVKTAVESEHVDRKALGIALKLWAMEDDDLHVTLFHLMDYIKKLGITKRAMAQEEMFEEHKTDLAAVGSAGKKPRGGKKADAKADAGNVTQIGAAARKVAESAGHPVRFEEGA
jgi:hypothetical protein